MAVNIEEGDEVVAVVTPPPVTSGQYAPPAVVGEISVTVAWPTGTSAPTLASFALPSILRLLVCAETEAGGTLDPAGIPIEATLSSTAAPAAGATWLTATYDAATRLAEIAVPSGTPPGSYFLCWRSKIENNAPNLLGGQLQGIVRIG